MKDHIEVLDLNFEVARFGSNAPTSVQGKPRGLLTRVVGIDDHTMTPDVMGIMDAMRLRDWLNAIFTEPILCSQEIPPNDACGRDVVPGELYCQAHLEAHPVGW